MKTFNFTSSMLKAINYIIIFSFLLYLVTACKSNAEPKIYDSKHKNIEKESIVIYRLMQEGNYDEAKNQINLLEKKYGKNETTSLLTGFIALNMKNYELAESIFRQISKDKSNNTLSILGLIKTLRVTGKLDEAINLIDSLSKENLTFSSIWFEYGLLQYEKKQFGDALLHFNKAFFLNNQNSDAYFMKYLCHLNIDKNIDKVKHYWYDLIKKFEMKPWYYVYHANYLIETEKIDFATIITEDGLSKFKNDIYLNNLYLFIKLNADFTKEALNENKILRHSTNIVKTNLISPEIIDTYLLYLYKTENYIELETLLNHKILEFPESEHLFKWLKKIKQ